MKHAPGGEGQGKRGGGLRAARPGPGRYGTGGRPGRYADGGALGRYRAPGRYGPSDQDGRHTDEQHAGNQAVNDSPHDGHPGSEARGTARPPGAEPAAPGAPSPDLGGPGSGAPGGRGPGTGGPGGSGPGDPGDGDGPFGTGDGEGPGDHEGPGGHGDDDEGLGADELALRRLLKQAVQDVEPRQGSLDHLRSAVPARRARKRQAVIGLTAAAVLIGVAVPTVVHVSNSNGAGMDRPSVAGHGEQAHGGTGDSDDGTDGGKGGGQSAGPGDKTGGDSGGSTGGGHDRGGAATEGPDPDQTLSSTSPACVAAALGGAQAGAGQPEADGKVYGSFRVTNVSDSDCTVDDSGSVVAVALGAADSARINVVDHTEGDPAVGLPSPSQEPAKLVLQPGMAYEVRFAWVPSGSCSGGTTGGGSDSSPDPTPSGGSDGSGGSGDSNHTDMTSQLYREDDAPADGSVSVSHTAAPGSPTAATTIPDTCAGTLYRTGLLPAS